MKKRRGKKKRSTSGKALKAPDGRNSEERHTADNQETSVPRQSQNRTTVILNAKVAAQGKARAYGIENEIGGGAEGSNQEFEKKAEKSPSLWKAGE